MSSAQSWIAQRYFFSRRKTRFLPLLTATAIGGVALGTCAMVVILSVMQGFNRELTNRLLGFNAHITVTEHEGAAPIEEARLKELVGAARLVDAAPFVEGEVIVEAKLGQELFAQGAKLRGLKPDALGRLREVRYYFPSLSATPESALTPRKGALAPMILGAEILGQLNVHPDFKDTIEAIAPLADVGPTGEMEPRLKKFALVGSFTSGVYEYDTHYALVPIDDARALLGAQAAAGWQLRITDPPRVAAVAAELSEALGPEYTVEGWHTRNKKLFAALKLERMVMMSVLTLVVLIATFSVVGVIMMVVAAKRKDIALLMAMGMRRARVRGVFVRQGTWIGIVGVCIGGAVGIAVCLMLAQWPIRLPESYYVETLVVELSPWLIAMVGLVGVALATASAVYPVRKVTPMSPIEALRYE